MGPGSPDGAPGAPGPGIIRLDLAWAGGLALLAAACFVPVLLRGKTTLLPVYENISQWLLYREFIRSSFGEGRFPLWCPGLFCGLPFAGWSHASVFYPLSFFFFIFDFVRGTTWNTALHLVITLTGFYALCRSLGLGPHPSGVAATWYGFGCMGAQLFENYLPSVFGQSLTPWVFFFLVCAFRTGSLRWVLAGGATAGAQLLAGHFELVAYQFLLGGIGLFLWFLLFQRGKPGPGLPGLLRPGAALFLGGLLALVLILPAMEYVYRTVRSIPFSYELYTSYSSPRFLLHLWDFGQTTPLLAFMFLAGGVRVFRDGRAAIALILIAFCVIFVSNLFGIQRVFFHLPVFSKFTFPWRMTTHEFLVIGVMLGIGVQGMLAGRRSDLWALGMAAVLVVSWLIPQLTLSEPGSLPDPSELPLVAFKQDIYRTYGACAPWLAGGGALVIAAWPWWRKNGTRAAAVLVAAMALGQWLIPFAILTPARDPADYEFSQAYMKFLENAGRGRMLNISRPGRFASTHVPGQAGVRGGSEAVNAYITVPLLSYSGYIKSVFDKAYVVEDGLLQQINIIFVFNHDGFLRQQSIPLLDLMNLKYVVTQARNIEPADLQRIVYNDYQWTGRVGACETDVISRPPLATAKGPCRFVQPDVYVEPDSSLASGIRAADGPAWAVAIARRQSDSRGYLVQARAVAAGQKDVSLTSPLGPLASTESLFDLEFSTVPAREGSGLTWVDPELSYPSRHFKRLDVRGLDVFVNPSVMPRAFIVHGSTVIADGTDRISYLQSGAFQPYREVILEEPPPRMAPSAGGLPIREGAGVIDYREDQVRLRGASSGPGWLVLSDVYYPGWEARVDGEPARIFRADQAFRGVAMGPGMHNVTMVYRPRSFRIGLWASLSSLVLFALAAAARARRPRRQPS